MSMTRRTLLGALIGAMTMDPEKLLWVPGKKLISIPKPYNPAWRVISNYYSIGFLSASANTLITETLTCDHIPTSFDDIAIERFIKRGV